MAVGFAHAAVGAVGRPRARRSAPGRFTDLPDRTRDVGLTARLAHTALPADASPRAVGVGRAARLETTLGARRHTDRVVADLPAEVPRAERVARALVDAAPEAVREAGGAYGQAAVRTALATTGGLVTARARGDAGPTGVDAQITKLFYGALEIAHARRALDRLAHPSAGACAPGGTRR